MIYQINIYLSYDVLYSTRILLVIWCLLFIFILEYKCYPIKGVSANRYQTRKFAIMTRVSPLVA